MIGDDLVHVDPGWWHAVPLFCVCVVCMCRILPPRSVVCGVCCLSCVVLCIEPVFDAVSLLFLPLYVLCDIMRAMCYL